MFRFFARKKNRRMIAIGIVLVLVVAMLLMFILK